MLVLSRKKNESIVINNDITIVVVEIRGDKVRLGVEAPKEVPVHRREVYDAIKRNEAAASEAPTSGRANNLQNFISLLRTRILKACILERWQLRQFTTRNAVNHSQRECHKMAT